MITVSHGTLLTSVTLRYSDMDALGHLNNAVYATLFEAGRVDYVEQKLAAMTPEVPNSGTADRGMAALLAGGALTGGAAVSPYIALGAIPAAMYTGPGQRAMAGLLAGRQGPSMGLLSDAVGRLGVPAGLALTPALQGLLSQ
jgi:hypothetical protein